MKKLGLVLVALAAIALVYAPVMAADKAAAPAAEKKATEKPAVKAKVKKEAVTLTGMLSEGKNKKGKVIFSIQTDQDSLPLISKGKVTAELAKMVGKKVEAKGRLIVGKKGKKFFYVSACKEAM